MKLTLVFLASLIAVAMCQTHCDHHHKCQDDGSCRHHQQLQCVNGVCVCTDVAKRAGRHCTEDSECLDYDCTNHHHNSVPYCYIEQHNNHQGYCDCRPKV